MTYTKETLVIKKPFQKLKKLVSEIRKNKQVQLEKLRKQPKCTFQIHL